MIPSFLLAKLYVKGSLKNTPTGFGFNLKNIIDSTTLTGIGPIKVGEEIYDGQAIAITVAGHTIQGTALAAGNPVPVPVGVIIEVTVAGEKLVAGQHKISITATTVDIGKITFDIHDSAA